MKYKNLFVAVSLVGCVLFSGCVETARDNQIFGRYYMTTLKFSTSADVLSAFNAQTAPNMNALVSQSPSVIGGWGQDTEKDKLWFNVVAFDEEKLTAARKYAMLLEENSQPYVIIKKHEFRFDSQSVVSSRLLAEPFDNENARNIAILKNLSENFNRDSGQLIFDSADLRSAAMLTKHVFATILTKLDQSPALAANLPLEAGMEFDHLNLGGGRIRMVIADDILTVKIKIGEISKGFENQPDVKNM